MTSNTHMETDCADASGAAATRAMAARDLWIISTSGSFLCLSVFRGCRQPALQQVVQIHSFDVFGLPLGAHPAEEGLRRSVAVIGGPVFVRGKAHHTRRDFIHQTVLVPDLDSCIGLGETGDGFLKLFRSTKVFGGDSLEGMWNAHAFFNGQLPAVLQHLPG